MNCPYKQLVNDYLELDGGIDFGRIMNFIWKKLPDKELYLVIRGKVTLRRLCKMMGEDWCENVLRSESGSMGTKLDPKTGCIFNTRIPNIGRCDLLIKLASGWK